ncbi:aminoglycoside phosphotransferase family protein [Oceanibium sediminis]|uniref:aminoglycoside phosphotransferase family protein n=1 Tax=Oceanibium sediminis TaxID=2026339 RepID=UPI000DD38822|nr:phosphotransferase [Oceanibium sediminis]
MSAREAEIAAFLSVCGWSGAWRAALAGDASNRRYERLTHPRLGRAVLMDAPPARGEDVRPFQQVTARLRAMGLSAPEILGADPALGLLLLEDLGDALFARMVRGDPGAEPTLYAAAVDLIVALQDTPGAAIGLPPYDDAVYRREVSLLPEWYLQAAPGAADRGDTLRELMQEALDAMQSPPAPVMVMRDYHAENLVWLPDRTGHARIGLLDYQDALAGHPAYDLVSLLEDARRDTPEALQEAMVERYIAARGGDAAAFRHAYAVLGAQRNLKILGIFTRLWLRDGKPQYLDLLPRVWGHLRRDLSHPALTGLAAWVAREVPPPDQAYRAALRAAGC